MFKNEAPLDYNATEISPTGYNPKKEREADAYRARTPCPFLVDDPKPSPASIGKKEFREHIQKLRDYTNGMLAAYQRTQTIRKRILWEDFVSAFRPYTIRAWTRPMLVEWKGLMAQLGLYITENRCR